MLACNQLPREPEPSVRNGRARAVIARTNRPVPPPDAPASNRASGATTARVGLDAGIDSRHRPGAHPRAYYNSALSSLRARRTSRPPDPDRTTAESSLLLRWLPPLLHPLIRAEMTTMAPRPPPLMARMIPRLASHHRRAMTIPSRSPRCHHPHPRLPAMAPPPLHPGDCGGMHHGGLWRTHPPG